MKTLDEPKLAAELGKTVEDGKRLEALWNKHMSAAISASPELATMPGMQKLARYASMQRTPVTTGLVIVSCCSDFDSG